MTCIVLAGCSNDTQSTSNENDNQTNQSNGSNQTEAAFKEVETFEIEGELSRIDMTLDEAGEIFFWNEQDKRFSDPERKYIRILEDETILLENDEFKLGTSLLPSGKVYTDRSSMKEDMYKMYIYDPRTKEGIEKELPKEVAQYVMPILHTNSETISEKENTYIHFQTHTKNNVKTFLWNYETGETKELSLMQAIRDAHDGEEVNYPRLQLTSDAKKVYVLIDSDGIYEYDVEKEQLEILLSYDEIVYPITYTSFITLDERYIPYVNEIAIDEEKQFDQSNLDMKLLDVETKESIDLGIVKRVFPQTDGNIVLYKDDALYYFDIAEQKETLIHTFELKDNQKIINLAVSANGKTIVAIIETEEVNDDDRKVNSQKAHVLKK